MKLIAHRGNVSGPKPSQENNPEYIDEALFAGFDAEIDLRYHPLTETIWLGTMNHNIKLRGGGWQRETNNYGFTVEISIPLIICPLVPVDTTTSGTRMTPIL